MKKLKTILLLTVIAVATISCKRDEFFDEEEQAQIDEAIIVNYLDGISLLDRATRHESGIYYIIDEDGGGRVPEFGETVIVHYQGFLLNGELFDSSLERGPFDFVLGRGDVIRGWDISFGLIGKGTSAVFIIPSGLAYGSAGFNDIPPNSVLQFEVTLLDIR